MKQRTQEVRTIELDRGQVFRLDGARGGRVRVLQGSAWLTCEGEWVDALLDAGSERRLYRGRTLIEALGPLRLQVEDAAAPRSEVWRRAWQGLRRQVTRLQMGPAADQVFG